MELARLILEYLKALSWPSVVVFALLLFRGHIRMLVERIIAGKLPGGVELQFREEVIQTALEAGKAGAELQAGEQEVEKTLAERSRLVEEFARKAEIAETEKNEFLTQLMEKDRALEHYRWMVGDAEERLESYATGVGAANPQLSTIRANWRRIGEVLKRRRKSIIQACLVDTMPALLCSGILTVFFPNRTFAEMFTKHGSIFSDPLTEAIAEVTGIHCQIRVAGPEETPSPVTDEAGE